MKHGASGVSPQLHDECESKSHFKNTMASRELKQNISVDSCQFMNNVSLGQCCHLPAVLESGTSCSFAHCRHCIYTGESDALKRANGLGSCIWHLNGMTHIGAFENGFPCGWGTRTWEDGVVHKGFWKGHKLNGRGLVSFVDGSSYHGMLVDSARTGQGFFRSAAGHLYEGSWHNDKPHGVGRFSSRDINYFGDWLFGMMHGNGIMTTIESNGATQRYEGSFVHGKRDGWGVEESGDKSTRYCGAWKHNLRHGLGSETAFGMGVYVGEWKDDLRHGTGVFKSSQRNKYHHQGEWQDGMRHGRAIVQWNSGDSFACTFVKGKMVGPGLLQKTSSLVNPLGATLLVHSGAIHTTKDGARASARQAGTPQLFLLPARTQNSKAKKQGGIEVVLDDKGSS
jgi:hypothetical protein